MATLTYVKPEDVEIGDLLNFSSVPILESDLQYVPDEYVLATSEAIDVDKFNVKIETSAGYFIVERSTAIPYDDMEEFWDE